MGTLEDVPTSARHPMRPDHLIGRSERVDLRIDDRNVSSEHARVHWTGRAWVVRDLGSRNGTWVAGRRLGPGESTALAVGATLGFGSDAPRFRLASADPPAINAVDRAGVRVFGRPDLLALPTEDEPRLVVVGDRDRWRVEAEDGVRDIENGARLAWGAQEWTLELPEPPASTWDRAGPVGVHLADARFQFQVSMDEEHVALTVTLNGREVSLGSRSHHYLLLTLARLRRDDAANADLRPTAHGWVAQDDLRKMLGMSEGALHVAVFRARSELSELGISDAAGLIERRKGSQQLRLGVTEVAIAVV